MKRFLPLAGLAVAMGVMPSLAQAQASLATTAKTVHLRAGPARDFPVVAVLPAGLQVEVQGCLAEYTWCDVVAGYSRGWVYAGNLQSLHQGRLVPLPGFAAVIGVVVLGFVLDDYWGRHYHDRPWYGERRRWVHPNPPPPRFVPGPAPVPQPRIVPHPPAPIAPGAPRDPAPRIRPAPQPQHGTAAPTPSGPRATRERDAPHRSGEPAERGAEHKKH